MPARPISSATLGEVVRSERLDLGLTQEELADRAQIHVTYLSGIERGKKNPTLGMVNALAGALQIAAIELLQLADERGR